MHCHVIELVAAPIEGFGAQVQAYLQSLLLLQQRYRKYALRVEVQGNEYTPVTAMQGSKIKRLG